MFIETSKGDFIALDTIARITYWTDERHPKTGEKHKVRIDDRTQQPICYVATEGYLIETKRGTQFNVTDPELMALIKKVINHA